MDGEHSASDRLPSEPAVSAVTEDAEHPTEDVSRNSNGATVQTSPSDPFKAGVTSVTESEIGIQTLLNRLKQSIASAKEFALFLQRRSRIEDDHAQQLRKIGRSTHDALKRPECRGGSFLSSYDEVSRIEDAMVENGLKFAGSLHQMHDDLSECVLNVDKARKIWKSNGLTAEQRHQDTEAAMFKAKNKYQGVAEDYDRARTGDGQKRVFGLKGPKSMEQREEELLRKVQAADGDYAQKVQTAQSSRAELLSRGRPEAVKNLLDLIRECDSALTLQMQKYASFNEKLLLHNGLSISPLKGADGEQSSRSLRDVVASIDNDRDMNYYIASYASKVPPKPVEIKYERHSVLNPVVHPPQAQPPPQAQRQSEPTQSFNSRQGPPGSQNVPQQQQQSTILQNAPVPNPAAKNSSAQSPMGQHPTGPGQMGPSSNPLSMAQRPMDNRGFNQAPNPNKQLHDRSFSTGQQQTQPPATYNANTMSRNGPTQQQSLGYNSGSLGSSGAPQLSSLPFQTQQSSPYQSVPASAQNASNLPPLKPVFGLTLEQLFDRDGSAVPMVVYQCIQAVDLFGLEVEGIYRLSGTSSHINKIKAIFDNDASKVDFRNPENFFHDVNSVAGLMKQFFRDLPDPLLTTEHYSGFIEAAKHDDDIVRRDSLHAIINSLPDPNYATLRALTLHLNRVQENSGSNRMNASNLAIVFGPTLMGANTGPNIQDAGWQVRVIDTILNNTYQIFDDD